MRWLVFFLLVSNALMYAWFSFNPRSEAVALNVSEDIFSKAGSLVLLSELDAKQLKSRDARLKKVVPKAKPMCVLLGVFPEVVTAKQAAGKLAAHDIVASAVNMMQTLPPVHWVYIAPAVTRDAAIKTLRKLQSAGVDSFMVADGEYANAISLGYFSKIDSARGVMDEKIAEGYDAHAILKSREEEAVFLALDEASSAKFSTDLLENLQLEDKALKKQEKDCETVASLKVIE